MRVLGLSSGTSIDAIDIALARIEPGPDPGVLRLEPLGHLECAWDGELRAALLAVLPPAQCSVAQWCQLETRVGQAFAEAAAHALSELGPADLICSHGQTLYHWVDDGRAHGTLQLGEPAWIHARTGLPVVHNLRAADIAAGGHGAPLVSLLDQLWLADQPTAVVNIGGIANVTLLGTDAHRTGDTGPGSCLLDAAANARGARYDADGQWARSGTPDEAALQVLLDDPYYRQPFPRSTGREYFHREYVTERLRAAGVSMPSGDDLFTTLTELTARTIGDALSDGQAQRLVVSGGGTRNPALMERLAGLGIPMHTTTDLGLPSDAKEAYLFALLGYLGVAGLPGTAPADPGQPDGRRVTGAELPAVLGSLTPPAPPPSVAHHPPVTRLEIAPT